MDITTSPTPDPFPSRLRSRRFARHRVAVGATAVLVVITLIGWCAPFVAPHGMNEAFDVGAFAPPSADHLLGTDSQSRDVLTRLIWGARLAVPSAVLPALIAAPIGLAIGALAAEARGALRDVLMRLVDVGLAFPIVLLAIAIAGVSGGGFWTVMIAITVALAPYMARVSFSVADTVRASDYVIAARAGGTPRRWLIWWEILPNVLPSLAVYATSVLSGIMVVASGLSFFGLGIAPPAADWGQMINDGRVALSTAPLVSLAPGAMIVVCAICFTFIGDGVRDALDPRHG